MLYRGEPSARGDLRILWILWDFGDFGRIFSDFLRGKIETAFSVFLS